MSGTPGRLALRHKEQILSRAADQVRASHAAFHATLDRLSGLVSWVEPRGGTTAFPWLTFTDDSRPFAEALAAEGVLVAPGDCFGTPRHFRMGLGSCATIPEALGVLEGVVRRVAR